MARSVSRGTRQWMPFVRRRICGPRSDTPAAARSSSTHGPVALTTMRAPRVATLPVRRSRARTPVITPRWSRAIVGAWGVVKPPRAGPARGEDVLETEALGEERQVVEVVAGAAQITGPQHGFERERVDGGQHAIALAPPPGREPVVELQAD